MPKHIVHIASAHFPLDTRVFYKECLSLAAAGFKVTLLVQAIPPDFKAGDYQGVEIVPFRPARNRLTRAISLTRSMYQYALNLKADLYHIHDWELLPWAALLRKKLKKPVVFDRHEYYVERFRETPNIPSFARPVVSWVYKVVESFCMHYLDGVITVNEYMSEYCRTINKNTITIHNYPPREVAQRATFRTSSKQVIYVGTMARDRGYQTFIEGMILVREQMPEARALLLGWLESPEVRAQYLKDEPAMRERAGIRLMDRVPHDKVIEYIDQSAIGWIPWLPAYNRLHATPLKLFEYMAAGKPVVASQMGFMEGYVTGAQCGLLAEPGNAVQHAEAILRLLNTPEEAERMGENGKRAILEHYNWEKEAEKLVDFYCQLLHS